MRTDATSAMTTSRNLATAEVTLTLPARAENIAIVRHAIGALGDALPIDQQTLSDIRLAITEACTNVVVHAYPERDDGALEVEAMIEGDIVTVVVRDEGSGIHPRADSPGLGLGLPLIASVAENVQLGHDQRGHTEVRMGFSLGSAAPEGA